MSSERSSAATARPSMIRAGTASGIRLRREPPLERVRREVRLQRAFSPAEFERAFRSFTELYHVRPTQVLCSPDVLERYCVVYDLRDEGMRRELRFRDARLSAAVLPPGTVAFEGEVDPDRMGDW